MSWTLEQAANDLERYVLRGEPPSVDAAAMMVAWARMGVIDRPTCFDKESKNSKFFICSACGFSDSQVAVNPFTLEIRYVKPSYNYCPNCGAEVIE